MCGLPIEELDPPPVDRSNPATPPFLAARAHPHPPIRSAEVGHSPCRPSTNDRSSECAIHCRHSVGALQWPYVGALLLPLRPLCAPHFPSGALGMHRCASALDGPAPPLGTSACACALLVRGVQLRCMLSGCTRRDETIGPSARVCPVAQPPRRSVCSLSTHKRPLRSFQLHTQLRSPTLLSSHRRPRLSPSFTATAAVAAAHHPSPTAMQLFRLSPTTHTITVWRHWDEWKECHQRMFPQQSLDQETRRQQQHAAVTTVRSAEREGQAGVATVRRRAAAIISPLGRA